MRYFCFALLLTFLSCSNHKTKRSQLIHFIPQHTIAVLKTGNIEGLKSDIQNSDLIQKLSKTTNYINLEQQLESLALLEPEGELLICFTKNKNDSLSYSIITKHHKNLFKTDSLSNYTQERLAYKNKTITKSNLNNNTFYSTVVDSIFFASSSQQLVNAAFSNSYNQTFEKFYKTTNKNKSLSVIMKTDSAFVKSFFIEDALRFKSFSNHFAVDTDISQDEILINGITKASDSSKSLINIFKGNIPQENQIQKITPSNSDGLLSFTFNDIHVFRTNLLKFNKKDSIPATTLFDNLAEIGVIYHGDKRAVVLNAIDILATKEALLSELNTLGTYRQVQIFNFSKPTLFSDSFYPLVTFNKATKYCLIDNYVVFANSMELLQNIIANYQNKTTLGERAYFKTLKENLSDESSLLLLAKPSILKKVLQDNMASNSAMALDEYKLSAIQFIYDTNFAHVNGVIKKAKIKGVQNSITETFNIKLEAALLNNPQFVTKHVTRGKEIVVQDVNNNLYLISSKGKILWKKELQGPVLGDIEQIDIYRNGKLQLAFATPKRVYVIDRNGKDVSPFPKRFADPITQPLSVFDYENNKNYRLLVTQGKKLFMYDVGGKIVSGFTFKSANNTIFCQPKHFRMGGKDYLTFKTEDKLYILDRRGHTRIVPKTSSKFSEEAVYLYNNKFTTTTSAGNLITIDTKGNTAITNLNLSDKHHVYTTSKTLVTLSDNILTIKGRPVELEFGTYSRPIIFYLNDKIYVSVTDVQAQKIYLFDSQAKSIPNFPVYGSAQIDLGNIDKDRNLEFVTTGDDNTIILYKMN